MQVISGTGIVPVSIVTWFLFLIFIQIPHIWFSHTCLIYAFPLVFLSSSHLTLPLNFYCFPKTLAPPLILDRFFLLLFTYNFVISSFQIHVQELQEEAAPVTHMTCGANSLGCSASYPPHYEKNIRKYLEGNFLFRHGYRAACYLPPTRTKLWSLCWNMS